MGVRLVLFAAGFNLLLWLSRMTVSLWLSAHWGARAGVVSAFVAPAALLFLAIRVLPDRREALVGVGALSALLASLAVG